MKDDEKQFLLEVYEKCRNYNHIGTTEFFNKTTPRSIINRPGFAMHHKRAWYLLEKWCDKGWYSYGVTLDLGWLTCEGVEVCKRLLLERQGKET